MRVASKNIYDTMMFRLGSLTTSLKKANEVVTTGNRVNRLSDDPIGSTKIVSLRSSIENFDQIQKNIDTGRTWLNASETALSTTRDLISEAKLRTLQLANASTNEAQRKDAVTHIDSILRKLVDLGNTEINGSYIFAGTDNKVRPFEFDDTVNPTEVIYNGDSNSFAVKTGKISSLAISRDGEAVFWDDEITIDSTNNKIDFIEHSTSYAYPSAELSATVDSGSYTPAELAVAVRNAMNIESVTNGYGLKYDVSYDTTTKKFTIQDDGSAPAGAPANYDAYVEMLWGTGSHASTGAKSLVSDTEVTAPITIDISNDEFVMYEDIGSGYSDPISVRIPQGTYNTGTELAAAVKDAINTAVSGAVTYDFTFDTTINKFELSEFNGTNLKNLKINWATDTATTAGAPMGFLSNDIYRNTVASSIAPDMGFANQDAVDAMASDNAVRVFPVTVNAANNTIVFRENWGSGLVGDISVNLAAGNYADGDALATQVQTQLNGGSLNAGADYKVTYDSIKQKFFIREQSGTALEELSIRWSVSDAASTLGFQSLDQTLTPPTSQNEVQWGVFDTLIDLKGFLNNNDVDGISRSISRLETHFIEVETTVADVGQKINRLGITEQIIADLSFNYTEQRSTIEEADIVEAIMSLQSKEFVYEAALNTSARVMQLSLADFL